MSNEEKEENENVNREDIKQTIDLYIQYSLKTIDKEVLKNVNFICKEWKKEVSLLFNIGQKKLTDRIVELAKEKNEEEIATLLMDELFNEKEEVLSEEEDEPEFIIDEEPVVKDGPYA